MLIHAHLLILSLFFSLLSGTVLAYTPPQQTEQDFQQWLQNFKQQARQKNISAQTLNKAFQNIHLNHRVLELDRQQPEFTRTFWQYMNSAVTDWRIKKGSELYQQHKQQLQTVTQKYGVPGRFLIAFLGMETNYGDYTGNTPIIESLATLSYDLRRSDYFQKELIAALTILDQEHIPVEQMRGSWAGAMGQCQFMPSNYLQYAVDADQSGKRDLWNSLPDVFHSMGNFLKKMGWQTAENWGREVQLPAKFDYSLADGELRQSLTEWRKLGLKLADGRPLPDEAMDAALILPYDYRGPAFLVFQNFEVIKRWNRSDNYALAVGHLADRIVGRDALQATEPKNDHALTRNEILEMQQRLRRAGIPISSIDGIAGDNTKSALRAFQTSKGLPADGYPSLRMLNLLRQQTKP
ncbi:MAG: lytic murein transglycosylase [Piscirickettsiaceae bacterium CG_4_10_14_3_um_filter_44_349]|nr:lytic murein transglycosylase [Thiomicrospira sp.]OIP94012.1 MAG: lytic transglycosylase [Thiomicrospira sp. CG2_30_44_34]PIQ05456.1 MAG: lytic transglycosylase [Piscirickettsiaceae bacterium CG18_big_fil_WC_8_21_14_2_50_44_103]PIU39277.1 MAG: lytic murein transglycosylase [Piscirickettsiaceae bacterium CG07_land_8_20_14_0_80_44_28]PIW58313.1 MAG: lytic murein transglycosylase [Piscirickettsiaceae bacterium CG12_big_fil_rev_8_21_14_0_65_44_934]PIW77042.1 MAG: lytic murein transglycosylase [